MNDPQLHHWRARIAVPHFVVWGESDAIVTLNYGRSYAGLKHGTRFETIATAEHHPDIEQREGPATPIDAFPGR